MDEPDHRIDWDVRLEGRAWKGEEAMARYHLTPEKFEMHEGKLFWDDDERVRLLGCLLENVGAARAVQMGDREVWKRAVAGL